MNIGNNPPTIVLPDKMNQSTPSAKTNETNLPFYGLLIYTVLFYSQIATRFPALSPLRLEFVVGLCLVLYALIKFLKGEVKFNENKLNTAAMFFLLTALLTIPFAVWRTHALETFVKLFKFFSIYLMIIVTINTEKKLKLFMYVYLGMIAFLFIEPFFLSLQGEGFIYNNHMYRLAGVSGYFAHPNQLGGITAANLPFFYFLMKYDKSKIAKSIYFMLIVIALRVIMLTLSRTAFVGVITFGFFIWLFSEKKVISSIIIIFTCFLIWNFAPQETKDRFLTFEEADDVLSGQMTEGSMAARWTLIKNGFIIFLDNPMIGVGLDCYKSESGLRWHNWTPPHNTFIQALAEMGLLGFTAFLLLLIITLKNLKRSKRLINKLNIKHSFLATIITAVTVYLFVRCVVSMFGQDLYANYWWVAGGLSVVILRIANNYFLLNQSTLSKYSQK